MRSLRAETHAKTKKKSVKKETRLTRAGIHADLKAGRVHSFFFPPPRRLLNQRLALFLIVAVCTVTDSSLSRDIRS